MNDQGLQSFQTREWILFWMKLLNFFIIGYFILIYLDCIQGYILDQQALSFIGRIKVLPPVPWGIPLVTIAAYICLLVLLSIKADTASTFLFKILGEGCMAFTICHGLQFAYVGVFLLVVSDLIQEVSGIRWKLILVFSICGLYLLMDYNLISIWMPAVSFEAFLGYYSANAASILLGMRNLWISLNLFSFIIYMVMSVLAQSSEKERILGLNTELNQLNAELQVANHRLEEYAEESVRAAEMKERNRLAREIHDTLGHSLTGIITGIEACVMIMDLAPEATKEQLKSIAEVARSGINDVRRSVKALRPDALEHMDLEKALEHMVSEMRNSTGVEIRYICEVHINGFNQDEGDVIYRIVQEGITNAIRHGRATEIEITITKEYQLLKIHIKDNGTGCADIKKGFGLHHMQERLNILSGTLNYDGSDGFVIDAQIPIRWGKEEEHD